MAKRSGMYKSDKRRKELSRKKKQEEKRMRRQKNAKVSSHDPAMTESLNNIPRFPGAESDQTSE